MDRPEPFPTALMTDAKMDLALDWTNEEVECAQRYFDQKYHQFCRPGKTRDDVLPLWYTSNHLWRQLNDHQRNPETKPKPLTPEENRLLRLARIQEGRYLSQWVERLEQPPYPDWPIEKAWMKVEIYGVPFYYGQKRWTRERPNDEPDSLTDHLDYILNQLNRTAKLAGPHQSDLGVADDQLMEHVPPNCWRVLAYYRDWTPVSPLPPGVRE